MHRRNLHLALSSIVTLFAIIACALPGGATQVVPSTNPNAIETAIVGTIQAATATAQSIATKTPGGPAGAIVEQLPDGTTRYTDYDAGFEITFPAGWLAIQPNTAEFNKILEKDGAVNSMLHDQMTSDISTYEAGFDRLFVYILRPDLYKNVIFGFSQVTWDSDDPTPIDSASMGNNVRYLESQGPFPGYRVDDAQLHEDGNIKMIEIGGRWTTTSPEGKPVSYYSMFFVFKSTPNSIVGVNITFFQDYKAQLSEDVKTLIDSIQLLKQ